MANILLVDPDEIAQLAMNGMLSRGGHRCVAFASGVAAWEFLERNLKVDLVFMELKLEGGDGLEFLHRLKRHYYFKRIPVVVCAAHRTRENAKAAVALGIQNFFLKPFEEGPLLEEVSKSANPYWYVSEFEDKERGPHVAGVAPDLLAKRLTNLRDAVESAREGFLKRIEETAEEMPEEMSKGAFSGLILPKEVAQDIFDEVFMLRDQAVGAGAIGIANCFSFLDSEAKAGRWEHFKSSLHYLQYANRCIQWHLDPDFVPDDFLSEDELRAEIEARSRILWEKAIAEDSYPVLSKEKLQREVESLEGCPVIDSVFAAYLMTATGTAASLRPVMDLVDRDAGLKTQVLIAINQIRKSKSKGTAAPVEDARSAIGMLGEVRLSALGRGLIRVKDDNMYVEPDCSWKSFSEFLVSTAKIAEATCLALELPNLARLAYTAGLIHDIGKLLLLRLHPIGFQTILQYAMEKRVSLAASEKRHIDATTHQMGTWFAEKVGLPERLCSVIRWVDYPQTAEHDVELVAIVAMARHICRQSGVGFSGHPASEKLCPLEDSGAWQVMKLRAFPSFRLKAYEAEMKSRCAEMQRAFMLKKQEARPQLVRR